MKLDSLLVLRVDAGAPVAVGAGPSGPRLISTATGGTFEGAKLSGKVLPNGGDWILVDDDVGIWTFACCSKQKTALVSTSDITDS